MLKLKPTLRKEDDDISETELDEMLKDGLDSIEQDETCNCT